MPTNIVLSFPLWDFGIVVCLITFHLLIQYWRSAIWESNHNLVSLQIFVDAKTCATCGSLVVFVGKMDTIIYLDVQTKCGEYSVINCHSHKTLLWIWIILWNVLFLSFSRSMASKSLSVTNVYNNEISHIKTHWCHLLHMTTANITKIYPKIKGQTATPLP